MTEYRKTSGPADSEKTIGTGETPPDPSVIILHHVLHWMQARGAKKMPNPAPATPSDAVTWWIGNMQEREQIGETRKAALGGQAIGDRWETGYANRCAFSFLRWCDMSQTQRVAVCASVIDDRIPYRGDTFSQYMAIVSETILMRDHVNREEYAKKALRRAMRFSRGAKA